MRRDKNVFKNDPYVGYCIATITHIVHFVLIDKPPEDYPRIYRSRHNVVGNLLINALLNIDLVVLKVKTKENFAEDVRYVRKYDYTFSPLISKII